jgi:hypothetical protein
LNLVTRLKELATTGWPGASAAASNGEALTPWGRLAEADTGRITMQNKISMETVAAFMPFFQNWRDEQSTGH